MTNAQSDRWIALMPHQGDWMKKSLDAVGLSAKGMAEYLGVEPETVSRWINAKRTPDLRTLRLWAMRTGVPLSYLRTGVLPSDPDDGPGQDSGKLQIDNLQDIRAARTAKHFAPTQDARAA